MILSMEACGLRPYREYAMAKVVARNPWAQIFDERCRPMDKQLAFLGLQTILKQEMNDVVTLADNLQLPNTLFILLLHHCYND